jgi:hypothetical protein
VPQVNRVAWPNVVRGVSALVLAAALWLYVHAVHV